MYLPFYVLTAPHSTQNVCMDRHSDPSVGEIAQIISQKPPPPRAHTKMIRCKAQDSFQSAILKVASQLSQEEEKNCRQPSRRRLWISTKL